MAGKIKGITIEIGGNTAPLDKALKKVNAEAKSLQGELKGVNTLLKMDPTNTELLTQRQTLLTKSVEQTKEKLEALRAAKIKVDNEMKNGTQINQEQYRNLQREIVSTEQKLKGLESQAKQSNSAIEKIGTAAKNIGDKATAMGQSLLPVTIAVAGLGALAVDAASDLSESMNKVDVAFKDSAESVKKFSDTTLDSFGIAKGTALDMASLFGDMGTAMGQTPEQAAKMSTSLVGLAGDLASFKNIGIEQAQEALKGIFTGEGESLKSLGVIMLDSTLQEFAHAQGIKKKYSEMTQAEKVQLRYNYVMAMTKNAQGDFARTSDGTANSMRIMQESLKELSAEFGAVLLPIITPIIQRLTELIKWFGGLDDGTKKIIVGVAIFVAVLAPLLIIFGAIAMSITAIIGVVGVVGGAFAALAVPIGIGIVAFGAMMAAGALLTALFDKVTQVAAGMGQGIKDTVKGAADFFGNQIARIKNFFNFKFTWPKLPLPHFSIAPAGWKIGDLLKGKIPSLGINWYDQGGVFNNPAIVGVAEKRPEFVGALEDLRYLIRDELIKAGIQGKNITNDVKIYNPVPEKASDSTAKQLTKLGYLGVFD